MPRYQFQGSDAAGGRVYEVLDRASKAEALAELEARGWSEIELVVDDAFTGWTATTSRDEVDRNLSVEERVELAKPRSATEQGGWWLLHIYRKNRWGYLAILGAVLARRYFQLNWSWLDWSLIGLFLLPLPTALLATMGKAQRAHQRYLGAVVEGRWADALEAVEALASSLEPLTLGMMRARCWAALGRREEAYGLLEQLRPTDPSRTFHYLSQSAMVYAAARDYQRERAANFEALALAPDKELIQIDLARIAAIRFQDPLEARRYLALTDRAHLPNWAVAARTFIEGVVLWEEGQFEAAKIKLDQAKAQVEPLVAAVLPLRSLLLFIEYYQALWSVRAGDRTSAVAMAQRLRPYLEAHGDAQLLKRLQDAGL